MPNIMTAKLETFAPLSAEDKLLLDEVLTEPQDVPGRKDLVREGDQPDEVRLITEGFACRYKMTSDGERHIVAYLIPGDLCDLHSFVLRAMDHSIATLSPCKVVKIPRARMLQLAERPAIARALWWSALVDEATLREWLVNIGARSAEKRVGHLLCELLLRMRAVGLTSDHRYELPLTQSELADTMGLSTVHMNRVLQSLRQEDMISLKGKSLVILDYDRLAEFSGFNPNYLHLQEQRLQGGIRLA